MISQHPDYATFEPRWRSLAHVADGTGPFMDGTALIPHPREWQDHDSDTPRKPTKKLLERRQLARYDHVATFVVEQKLAALFRHAPIRRCQVDGHPYLAWTDNVDGAGRCLTEWLRGSYRSSLIFGHSFVLMDRATDDGPTAADASPLVLRAYTPIDATDWLTDQRGVLTGVQLREAIARDDFAQAPSDGRFVVVQITPTTARRIVSGPSIEPTDLAAVAHGFGALPVVPLYAHRRASHPVIGQSALYDPALYLDLYNLASELRELLRKQTFSILNIPLGASTDGGPGTSLEMAQGMLGQTTGTNSVLFSTLPAQYLTAESENVTAYQSTIDALTRQIFRLTAVPFDQDSRDSESAEARRLKRADFATVLAGYADELQRAEYDLARLWFHGTYGERWQAEWDKAAIEIVYPGEFEPEAFADVLEQAMAAQALPVGESRTFRLEHSSRLIERFLPGAGENTLATIRDEIAAVPTPDERRDDRFAGLTSRMATATRAKSDAA